MYQKVKSLMLALGACVWFPELNVRRQQDKETGLFSDKPAHLDLKDGQTKQLILSIKDRGYDPQYPCVVGPITEEQQKEAVSRLEKLWEQLKTLANQLVTQENKSRLVAFEYFYVKDSKGKKSIIVPEYLGCTGNRRSQCLFEAAVMRVTDGAKDPEIDANNHPGRVLESLHMHCLYEDFASMDERQLRQIAENTAKTEGFKQLNIIETLLAVRDGVETGRYKQSDLRQLVPDGTGIKMHGFLTIAARFPKLKLMERIMLPEANPDSVIWSKLPQGEAGGFPSVVRRTNPVALEEYNARMEKKGTPEKVESPLTEEDVWGWFQEKKNKGTNDPKMMAKEVIKNIQSGNSSVMIRNLFGDVLQNKKIHIEKYTSVSGSFNELEALIGKPAFDPVTAILTKVNAEGGEVLAASLAQVAEKFGDADFQKKLAKCLS